MCGAVASVTKLERKGSLFTSPAHRLLPGRGHSPISGQNLKISVRKERSLHSDPRGSPPLGGKNTIRLKMKLLFRS